MKKRELEDDVLKMIQSKIDLKKPRLHLDVTHIGKIIFTSIFTYKINDVIILLHTQLTLSNS